MASGITLIIPHIPVRPDLLARALVSVDRQSLHPDVTLILTDNDREGAGAMRNRGIALADTEWVAFMDDDDELGAEHLATLCNHALETDGDVIWPWYNLAGNNTDPLPAAFFGRQWIATEPHSFPITTLVRTSYAKRVEFPKPMRDDFGGEDFHFWLKLSELGAKFAHVEARTWTWHHHGGNTSGAPGRW
jgi:glycosyltransferase involved in cell wall biosynthesis